MATTQVPDIERGENGSKNLNEKQVSAINANFADIDGGRIVASVTPTDGTDGTASVAIALVDGEGTALTAKALVNVWLSATAAGAATAADTSIVAATGLLKFAKLAAADYDVVSDATGAIVLTVTSGDTSSDLFANVEVGGVVTSAEVTITGN